MHHITMPEIAKYLFLYSPWGTCKFKVAACFEYFLSHDPSVKVHDKMRQTPTLLFSKIRISNSGLMYLRPLVAALGVELEIHLK